MLSGGLRDSRNSPTDTLSPMNLAQDQQPGGTLAAHICAAIPSSRALELHLAHVSFRNDPVKGTAKTAHPRRTSVCPKRRARE